MHLKLILTIFFISSFTITSVSSQIFEFCTEIHSSKSFAEKKPDCHASDTNAEDNNLQLCLECECNSINVVHVPFSSFDEKIYTLNIDEFSFIDYFSRIKITDPPPKSNS